MQDILNCICVVHVYILNTTCWKQSGRCLIGSLENSSICVMSPNPSVGPSPPAFFIPFFFLFGASFFDSAFAFDPPSLGRFVFARFYHV